MQSHAKQVVALINQLPKKDELRFLEKQPGNKKFISETNKVFISVINGLRSLVGDVQANSTTIPFKQIEETLDQFLENAAIQYDRMNKLSLAPKQPQIQKTNQLKPKDIYGFADAIQLNKLPFIPVLKYKQYAQTELDQKIVEAQNNPYQFFEKYEIDEFAHPYYEEILRLTPQDFVLDVPSKINRYRDLEPPMMITNADHLGELVLKIQQEVDQNGFSEIAVDLEHNHQISYLGITCLIQLSTRSQDYIIDPFPLWKQLGDMLSVIFANPKIVKVFHGAENDVQWLQRDFGLYIVNLFDTFHASKELQLMQNSFQFLLSEYCKKSTDKTYQTADWTQRPLPDEMIKYAQIDTHYLLYIYDRMRQDLKKLNKPNDNISNIPNYYLEAVLKRSKETALKIYKKPLQDQDQSLQTILNKQDRRMEAKSFELMVRLLELREELGIKHDQNPRYFLPNPFLFKIVESKPTTIQELKSQLGGDKNIHEVVKDNLWQFLKVLLEFDEKIPTVNIIQEEQQNTTQIQNDEVQPNFQVEPLKIVQFQVNIKKLKNQNKCIVENNLKNENVELIKSQFYCESPFKLLNVFYEGLGSQIFQSMKEQSQQQKQLIEETQQQKIEKINTSDFIKLPKLDEPNHDQKNDLDVRLNNTLQNQHGTKILKRHQKIEQQRTQKSNISNRFELS
ncbi:unnamed protein product (macronuclear) [Paramecium tetraurelia]|uniref:HRDC domain-containing protein n=1 Tax=Paramecium tetraurelia TaxID=5888 RepID=A0EBI7_PARTE|nr:uncharacterized protein GSPATT00025388001 [Paramecium tetraurelia]CAK92654.1 unnamed protein product [Paramecium tetraurelia]|eukprot:XP_001460051.1 hypothetical protein (macronuclear) [Paramecium tetraurelia strain d4-2]